ncbi:unnamed protein product [Arctogadus glacialis]
MINENLQDPSRTMSGGEVIFQGWLRKSPPEKKLRRYSYLEIGLHVKKALISSTLAQPALSSGRGSAAVRSCINSSLENNMLSPQASAFSAL